MLDTTQKQKVIELLLRSNVLRFGEFHTKSGRVSPYFFNTGHIDSAAKINELSSYYAEVLFKKFSSQVTNLFGPAYKGIPLAVSVASSLSALSAKDISFTYNRKEVKDHGEGGVFVGHSYVPGDKVVIVEDVLTGGTSLRETMNLFENIDVEVLGAIVGVDRQEMGVSDVVAKKEIEDKFDIPVLSLVNLDDIVEALHGTVVLDRTWIDDETLVAINSYRDKYGRRK